MSVNGTGLDRKTKKPRNDQTQWTVHGLGGEIHTDPKGKPLTGVNAEVAFSAVRALTRRGLHAVAVRQ